MTEYVEQVDQLREADELIGWLRNYAADRVGSRLIDERRMVPPHVVLDFGNAGLFGLHTRGGDLAYGPSTFARLRFGHVNTLRILEQLAAIDLTLATVVSAHANGAAAIEWFGTTPLRDEWNGLLTTGRALAGFALTESSSGSNPGSLTTRAVREPSGKWRISGHKYLVDHGSWASVFTVFALTSTPGSGPIQISAFAVPRNASGLVVGEESPTMGLRGMSQTSLTLANVVINAEGLIGEVGQGLEVARRVLDFARLNLSAKAIGGTKRCLQLLHRYASRREIGTGLLWENAVTAMRAADLVRELDAVQRVVYSLARRFDDAPSMGSYSWVDEVPSGSL